MTYANPPGGLPAQDAELTGRAVFNTAYALIPAGTMRDITASLFPGWEKTRGWIIARPMTGFAETFAHYVLQVEPGGGAHNPEPEDDAEVALFVTQGTLGVLLDRTRYRLQPGGFAYLPPRAPWAVETLGEETVHVHVIRKLYEPTFGVDAPAPFLANDFEIQPTPMPDTEGRWATTRFMDPNDMAHDMHITIVTLQPGAVIPFGHIIGPLVLWLAKRDDMPFVDDQGKEALNFQITMTLAFIVAALSIFVLIGFVLLPVRMFTRPNR